MLVLSRITGESMRLNDEITVTVLSVDGGKVKFGISVPAEVPVFRDEVYLRSKSKAVQKAWRPDVKA